MKSLAPFPGAPWKVRGKPHMERIRGVWFVWWSRGTDWALVEAAQRVGARQSVTA